MDLALFDFDGTITVDPTYPAFVRFAVRPGRKLCGGIILTPLILLVGLFTERSRLIHDFLVGTVTVRTA